MITNILLPFYEKHCVLSSIHVACQLMQCVLVSRDLVELSVYDELSSQDMEALSQIDDGADIVGRKPLFSFSIIPALMFAAFF